MDFFCDFPYFLVSVLLLILFFAIWTANRKIRSLLVFSGTGSAVYSISSFIFVPEYWQPVRVFDFSIGVEDLFFSFANGGIVFFFSMWPIRNRMQVDYKRFGVVSLFLLLSLSGGILWYLFNWLVSSAMTSLFITMAITGGALICRKNRYFSMSLAGACGFTLFYILLMASTGMCFPGFSAQWTSENLWGVLFLGFPIEEYIWAFGFGAVFPLIMATSFGLNVSKRRPTVPGD